MQKHFEYAIVTDTALQHSKNLNESVEGKLNQWGSNGWEVICITISEPVGKYQNFTAIFKREKL